ncbi:MAG: rhodanese-like domain-containing protein [Nostocoides sp.]
MSTAPTDKLPDNNRPATLRTAIVVGVIVVILGVVAALSMTSAGSRGTPTADATGTAYSADKAAFRLPGLMDPATSIALSDYAGTPVVVNFFASWCVYCNEELPGFVQVAKATKGTVQFIGVDTSDPGDGAAMATRFDLAGAGFALASDVGGSPPSDLYTAFGLNGLPATVLYDTTGKPINVATGMLTQDQLQDALKANYGVDVTAPDAADLAAPVIPLIPRGAFELLAQHPNDPAYRAVDLRPAAAFAQGHLDEAVNIPDAGDIVAGAAKLDKNGSYFLYDADGTTATKAADELHAAGFHHLYVITGGYAAWTSAGGPTTSPSGG